MDAQALPTDQDYRGYVDFFGFHAGAGGLVFCGWVSHAAVGLVMEADCVVDFGAEALTARGTATFFPRRHIETLGLGIVLFVPAPARPKGRLAAIRLRDGAVPLALLPSAGTQEYHAAALSDRLGPLLRASQPPLPETLVAALLAEAVPQPSAAPVPVEAMAAAAARPGDDAPREEPPAPEPVAEPPGEPAVALRQEGHLDLCTTTRATGWAVADGQPAALDVFVNEARLARVTCAVRRPNLAAFGLPVDAGFDFTFPTPIEAADMVAVRFLDGSELTHSPRQPVRYQSYVDLCTTARIVGWAVEFGQPAELEILVNDAPLVRLRCDHHRPTLAVEGLPVDAGFEFAFPQSLTPTDVVAVRFADGTPLVNSPCQPRPDRHRPRIGLEPEDRAITMVVGMHRSGTSLCSNLINLFGIDMGDDVDVAPSNARGHWERRDIVAFHDRVLNRFERNWYDPRHLLRLPPDWPADPAVRAIRDEMIRWLAAQCEQGHRFGFKDPRTARLLALWDDICAALRLEPRVVFCVRDPAQVARSLVVRDTMQAGDAAYRWMVYNSDAICSLGDRPVCIVPYEDWFAARNTTLARLLGHLGIAAAADDPAVAALLDGTIDPGLRHDQVDASAAPDSVAQQLYRLILDSVAHGRFTPAAREAAARFVAFEDFVHPVLAARLADPPPPKAAPEPAPDGLSGGALPLLPAKMQLAEGLVTTIQHHTEALRLTLEEIRRQAAPRDG